MIKGVILFFLLFIVSGAIPAAAQAPVNSDSLFFKAQDQARQGNYTESRQLLKQVLREAPEYTDAVILYGRTFAWQQEFDSARVVLEPLYRRDPSHTAVLAALTDIELWAGNPKKALLYADMGLQVEKDAQPFLLAKARALQQMQAYDDAALVLNYILELEPDHKDA